MILTVKIADLTKEMLLLEKVVSKKSNPILQNVLLRAESDGLLLLTASDIEIELTCRCAAVISEAGTVTIPARRLLDLLRVQSSQLVTLTTTSDSAQFTSGAFKSRLQVMSPDDFPLLPSILNEAIILPREALLRALAQVRFVVEDKTQAQYFLQGVNMDIVDQVVTTIALTTQRLALTSFHAPGAVNHSALLPIKLVDELLALLDGSAVPEVQFAQTDQHLYFIVGNRHLKSGLINGQFPTYRRMIPATADISTTVTVPRVELAQVLRRTLLIDETVHLKVGETLELSAKSADVGESQESITIVKTGTDTEMLLVGSHLLDYLNAATSPQVTIEMRTDRRSLLITDAAYVTVIVGMSS